MVSESCENLVSDLGPETKQRRCWDASVASLSSELFGLPRQVRKVVAGMASVQDALVASRLTAALPPFNLVDGHLGDLE